MKITDIAVETAIVPVEHQFVWRKGLPGSGTEQDTIRIVIDQVGEMNLRVIQGDRGATEVFEDAYVPPIVKQELTDR